MTNLLHKLKVLQYDLTPDNDKLGHFFWGFIYCLIGFIIDLFIGKNALELERINFNNCSSLGDIYNYRQYLESGTGRFGGEPELTLNGQMNGFRVSTSIVRAIGNITSLFKTGVNLSFSGRFVTDINCDLNTLGAFIDFSENNFQNNESLVIEGALITRNGVQNSSDTTLYPNIDNTSVRSLWEGNTGLPSTTKYIKLVCNTEITTVITNVDTYYPLEGTMLVENNSHISMPENGVVEVLSGNGTYNINGEIIIEGTQGNEVDLRVVLSNDGGLTYPTEINHVKRTINALSGSRDVAFMNINFIYDIKEGDRIRLEIENKTGTNNLTQELDSYISVVKI